jgi:hypothetical protein
MEIVEKIPRENVVVIRGTEDGFFCTSELGKMLKERGVRVIEIPGMGHVWNEKIFPVLEELTGVSFYDTKSF